MSSDVLLEKERNLKIAYAKRDQGIDSLAKGRSPLAIRHLEYSFELNPDDPVTVHWLGEAYRRRGLLDKAMLKFQRALELDPKAQEIRLNLAGLFMQLKRFPEAIEQSQILIDDPTFESPWRPYTNRGWAELQLGYANEARESWVEALAYRPDYWPARLNLGILEAKEGNPLRAIQNFEQVLERKVGESAEAEVNFRLGEVYVSLGRRIKAINHFKMAAKGSPYGRWAKRSEENLRLLY